jgi:hypothetical protein
LIVTKLQERADVKTKAWFTNYVKGTVWLGCKTPVVRQVVKEVVSGQQQEKTTPLSSKMLLQQGIALLQNEACDAKLAGMMVLSEQLPIEELATAHVLEKLETQVLAAGHVSDWSSADWFAVRVLQPIVLAGNFALTQRVLDYTRIGRNLWHRRCGVVSFVHYYKHRSKLPTDIGSKLIAACEISLTTSPEERFTQTGVAWALRYALLENLDKQEAMDMIVRHGSLWNAEAKKSLAEKLNKADPRKKQILSLG